MLVFFSLIFQTSLSVARSDEELELSCGEIFNKFGPCVVKVRRDKHKHPYALVQYQVSELGPFHRPMTETYTEH